MKESQYLPSVTKDHPSNHKARLYRIPVPQDKNYNGVYQNNAYYSAGNFQNQNLRENNEIMKQRINNSYGSEAVLARNISQIQNENHSVPQNDDRMKTSELKFRSYMKMTQNWQQKNATQGISSTQYTPIQMDQFEIKNSEMSNQRIFVDKNDLNTNEKLGRQQLLEMIKKAEIDDFRKNNNKSQQESYTSNKHSFSSVENQYEANQKGVSHYGPRSRSTVKIQPITKHQVLINKNDKPQIMNRDLIIPKLRETSAEYEIK